MAELGPPPQDLEGLQRENAMLRKELRKRTKSERRAQEIKKRALESSGSLLFTFFDRKKILVNFQRLFETVARFSGPQEHWPARDEIVADAKALSLSWVRFAIRRRTLMFLISLAAFVIPGIQIYLVFQQNEIIQNQNKFFELEVYDIVARSMTSGEMSAKQMTGALLARSDLDFIDGIVSEVFGAGAEMGVALTSADIEARGRRLREAAFRGHLILGLARAIDVHGEEMSTGELHREVHPMFATVLSDAKLRVPELIKLGRSTVMEDPMLAEEVYRYMANLGLLMRKQWSLALVTGEQSRFFDTIAPLLRRASTVRLSAFAEKGPLHTVFFDESVRQLLVDLALEPRFGEPPSVVGRESEEKLVREGFAKLRAGVGDERGVKWKNLEKLAEVP
jgi:hypothetical protein